MSLTAVYLQHRVPLLERHVSALVQLMKLHDRDRAADMAELERVWQAECEEMPRALLEGDRRYFDEREARQCRGGIE